MGLKLTPSIYRSSFFPPKSSRQIIPLAFSNFIHYFLHHRCLNPTKMRFNLHLLLPSSIKTKTSINQFYLLNHFSNKLELELEVILFGSSHLFTLFFLEGVFWRVSPFSIRILKASLNLFFGIFTQPIGSFHSEVIFKTFFKILDHFPDCILFFWTIYSSF